MIFLREERGVPFIRRILGVFTCRNQGAANNQGAWDAFALGEANIGALTRSLRSGDSGDQIEVSSVLGEIGLQAKESLPVLMDLTQSTNQWVRVAAATAAWKIGHNSAETLPTIVSVLRSTED